MRIIATHFRVVATRLACGTFQGPQFAIVCYKPDPGIGYVDVDWFQFSDQQDPIETTQASGN